MTARPVIGCPTCWPSSRHRGCASACRRQPNGPARRAGPTSSSSRCCSKPKSSRATPPAPANGSATPRFPAHKTIEDFDFTAQPSAEKPLLLHLAQLAWIHEHANVCLIGPPGTGKTHLAIALAIKACQAGHRVAFATAQQWVTRLEAAQDRNTLDDELRRLERYGLLVVDEVGYLPLGTPGRQSALRARLAPL